MSGMIDRFNDVRTDPDTPVPIRFVLTWAAVCAVMGSLAVGGTLLLLLTFYILILPTLYYHHVESEIAFATASFSELIGEIPMIWQAAQVLWFILLMAMIMTIVVMYEEDPGVG